MVYCSRLPSGASTDGNGYVQLVTIASLTVRLRRRYSLYPEYVNGRNIQARSVAFSGDCFFFVTQNNIWSYTVAKCPTSAPAEKPACSPTADSESYDKNKLFMYGAGIAAVGLFGWMLTR